VGDQLGNDDQLGAFFLSHILPSFSPKDKDQLKLKNERTEKSTRPEKKNVIFELNGSCLKLLLNFPHCFTKQIHDV
jgi:hypothetical protein